jgi:hypothetical protein
MLDIANVELPDIEITPEKIEAGLEEIWAYVCEPSEEEEAREGVGLIYLAMENARRRSSLRG